MSIKKNLVFVLAMSVLLSLFSGITVFSADSVITVEGENYKTSTVTPSLTNGQEFSNGKIISIFGPRYANMKLELTYEVNATEAGAYSMSVISSLLNSQATTDYSVQVNNGEIQDIMTFFTDQVMVQSTNFPNKIAKSKLRDVCLKQGINTIKIIVDSSDLYWGNVIFRLDCMKFTKTNFKINYLKADAGVVGVFEKSSNVSYNVAFNESVKANKTFRYCLTDFWMNKVVEKEFVPEEGADSFKLDLGQLPLGWYKLDITDENNYTVTTTMTVVPDYSSRKTFTDTPFAVDYASDNVPGYNLLKDYTKALKLAGINWGRERYDWSVVNAEKGKYFTDDMQKRLNIISDNGLKILDMTPPRTPTWAKPSGRIYADNLFDVYTGAKDLSNQFKDYVQAWEYGNEADLSAEAADVFAASYKAYAIGISDSANAPLKTFGGFALAPNTQIFMDLCLQNGIMNYSDMYNQHNHVTYDPTQNFTSLKTAQLNSHVQTEFAYDKENKAIWMTEAGMYCPVSSGESFPKYAEQQAQARYAVTSTVQSLAAGTTKHFWFVIPSYVEAGRELGSFYPTDTPYPVYASEAVMTYALGKGEYKGRLCIDDSSVYGYMFNNGENDVAVLWSENPANVTLKSGNDVTVTDIMGSESVVKNENGNINVNVSYNPVYVTFNGRSDINNYYPQSYNRSELTSKTFTENERVILYQKYPDGCRDNPKTGYILNEGKELQITLDINNFNNKEMVGKIYFEGSDGIEVNNPEFDVTLAPMGRQTYTITMKAKAGVDKETIKYAKFYGVFNGEATSPSIARVVVKSAEPVENAGVFVNANNVNGWNLSNIAAGGIAVTTPGALDNSVVFNVDFGTAANRWFYPQADVTDSERELLRDASGISFWVYCDQDTLAAKMNMFVHFTDGRQYYLGEGSYKPLKMGWNQVVVPWKNFILWSSPLGTAVDIRPFDQNLLSKVSIGVNGSQQVIPSYTLRDVGFYKKAAALSDEDKKITVEGIEEGKVYKPWEEIAVKAHLPEGINYTETRVLLNDVEYNKVLREGNEITVDLKGLKEGYYTLLVTAKSDMNFEFRTPISFIVDFMENTPPVTEIKLDGTENNGWFSSDVTVTLSATDNMSGVNKTEYSMGDSGEWITYTSPVAITMEGTCTIKYRSTDKAGNIEDIKQQTIQIDKTAPEMEVGFDPVSKKYIIHVLDTISGPQVKEITVNNTSGNEVTEYLLEDKAGNITELTVKAKQEGYEGKLEIVGILYNGIAVEVAETRINTNWEENKGVMKNLEQNVTVGKQLEIASKYMSTNNLTEIMLKTQNENDVTSNNKISKPGMVILKLQSAKGALSCPQIISTP